MACQHPFVQGNGVFSCYRCKPCLIATAEYWRDRQDLEYQDTRDALGRGSSFVTLTYAREHLPTVGADGRHHPLGILDRSHVRRFFQTLNQRLLRHGGTKVRYSLVGEYGERYGRPHYHAMLFGYAPSDRIGAATFREHVDAAWGRGRVDVGPVLKGGSHYISGYITGPRSVPGHPELEGRPPEFSSRSPGLGRGAVDRYADEFAKTPYASSVDDGVSKPITIKTEFREVWLRKSLLRRFFARLGYADPADVKHVEEVRMVGGGGRVFDYFAHSWVAVDTPAGCPSAAFTRHPELVLVPRTILGRANLSEAWSRSRLVAASRFKRIDDAHGPRELGGDPDVLATTAEVYSEANGDRIARLVAANAAFASRALERRVF